MKWEVKEPEYEAAVIVDYGDLVEVTAGHAHDHVQDSGFHPGSEFHHPSFSS